MSELRYCRKCRQETMHDVERKFLPTDSRADRWIWGVASLGISELMADVWATCQRCGKKEVV